MNGRRETAILPTRDHPSTIKKRFLSVFVMMFVSPAFLKFFTEKSIFDDFGLFELLGFRCTGLLNAIFLPLLLTAILFIGPLSLCVVDGHWAMYLDPDYWSNSLRNLVWLRNYIVAPFSEEFTFRACMMPLLLQRWNFSHAIFICPLFFGVAHFHHMIERLRIGGNFGDALLLSCFQFAYTTAFGTYSAFLFLRTGHFISVFLVHSFCNHIGFPDFGILMQQKQPLKAFLIFLFVAGVAVWYCSLDILASPDLYGNTVYLSDRWSNDHLAEVPVIVK